MPGTRALEVAARNGFDDADPEIAITVEQGVRTTQLRVTISSKVDNQFGQIIGVSSTGITRTAVADFTGPAPMGSPPIIVLATDGLPNNCAGGDTQNESVQAARNAYTAGIRTFVLGIAGVNDGFLQNMANAGQGVQANQPKFLTTDKKMFAERKQAWV